LHSQQIHFLPAFPALAMIIGLLEIDLFIPESHSLKDKRSVLQKTIHRLRREYNVAVAETGDQDKWARAMIAVVTVSTLRDRIEETHARCCATSKPPPIFRCSTRAGNDLIAPRIKKYEVFYREKREINEKRRRESAFLLSRLFAFFAVKIFSVRSGFLFSVSQQPHNLRAQRRAVEIP
jgi:uncharacterized protein YlxP (DUF503 family)